jgi:hypothetical protein
MPHDLHSALTAHKVLRDRLLSAHPDLAEDDRALADTLEGISDLNEAILTVFDSAAEDEMLVDALGARIDVMKERRARFENRVKAKRAAILAAMEEAGVKKIEAPHVTLSCRAGSPFVQIIDEAQIPPRFWREKIDLSIDKAALKEALQTETIPGACLSNGAPSLAARTK